MLDLGDIIERPINIPGPSRLLDTIRTFEFLKGTPAQAWVAGGAALRLARGLPELGGGQDVDIFVRRQYIPIDARAVEKIIKETKGVQIGGVANGTLNFNLTDPETKGPRIPLQLIQFKTFGTLDELFETFDFTVCMFATDGYTIRAPELAWKDLEANRLRISSYEIPRKTIKRISKYSAMGFAPEPGFLRKFFDELPQHYTFDSEHMTLHAPIDQEY